MATSIDTYYGTQVGPNDVRFRAVSQLQYTDSDPSKGYFVQRRYYAEVVKNPGSTFTSHAKTSWGINDFAMNAAGKYADTGWKDVGWVAYGSTVTANGYVYYNASSGTQYKSSVAGSYTIPTPTYTVSYNANGGSGAPEAQKKTHGKDLTLSSTKPTRSGYIFQGWSTSTDDSVEYAAGATYSANASVTLYAVWKAGTYTVSYNANGGSGAPASQTKTYGKDLTLSSTRPTKDGYTFQGWSTTASGSVEYAAGATYSANASVTLYAVWKAVTITVTFHRNQSSDDTATKTVTYTYGVSNQKFPEMGWDRSGYTPDGWSRDKTATNRSYGLLSSVADSWILEFAPSVDLYLVWLPETIEVIFHRNYSSEDTATKTVTYTYGVEGQKFPGMLWTKSGYSPDGWSTDPDATERTYGLSIFVTDSLIMKLAPAIDLYMVWERQTNGYIKQNGVYKACLIYQKNNAAYKSGAVYAKNGTIYKNT